MYNNCNNRYNFDSLQSLESYIKSVYYSNYPITLCFQVHFQKLKWTKNTNKTIKNALKNERKKKVSSQKNITKDQKRKYKELKRDIIEIQS